MSAKKNKKTLLPPSLIAKKKNPSYTNGRHPQRSSFRLSLRFPLASIYLVLFLTTLFEAMNDSILAVWNDFGLENLSERFDLLLDQFMHHRWMEEPPPTGHLKLFKRADEALMVSQDTSCNQTPKSRGKAAQGVSPSSKSKANPSRLMANRSTNRSHLMCLVIAKDLSSGISSPRSEYHYSYSILLLAVVFTPYLLWLAFCTYYSICRFSPNIWVTIVSPVIAFNATATLLYCLCWKVKYSIGSWSMLKPRLLGLGIFNLFVLYPPQSQLVSPSNLPYLPVLDSLPVMQSPSLPHLASNTDSHFYASHLANHISSTPIYDHYIEEGYLPQEYHPFYNSSFSPSKGLCLKRLEILSLRSKIWSHNLPFTAINHLTKVHRNDVKGKVDYINMGYIWIMFRFSTSDDRHLRRNSYDSNNLFICSSVLSLAIFLRPYIISVRSYEALLCAIPAFLFHMTVSINLNDSIADIVSCAIIDFNSLRTHANLVHMYYFSFSINLEISFSKLTEWEFIPWKILLASSLRAYRLFEYAVSLLEGFLVNCRTISPKKLTSITFMVRIYWTLVYFLGANYVLFVAYLSNGKRRSLWFSLVCCLMHKMSFLLMKFNTTSFIKIIHLFWILCLRNHFPNERFAFKVQSMYFFVAVLPSHE